MCVVLVAWNNPPNKPIPVSKLSIYKETKAWRDEKSKPIKAFRLYNIDLSRLKVTAMEKRTNIIECITT